MSHPASRLRDAPQGATTKHVKLFRPAVRPQLVPRPRLYRRLDEGLTGHLTLVCAAAGFGKTTLVSAWLADLPMPSAWLSLDERDSDVAGFAQYLAAAVRTVHPGSCAKFLEMATSATPPGPEALAETLSNDLARLPGRLVLAMDDYYALHGVAVHDLLTSLFRQWPPQLHLVLITRHNPPLPLAGLRARGQLTEIRSRDLRFSLPEMGEVMRGELGTPLSEASLARLDEHTEGWITGVHLAALSLRDSGDADRFLAELSGADANVSDYLIDEILAQQPDTVQAFLLRIAPLSRFCAALCGAVAEPVAAATEVQDHLDWMVRTNLFVVPLDAERTWFRLHHLFRDVLRRRLIAQVPADEVRALHRRAASWWSAADETDEALHHALAAGDPELAAGLVEDGLRAVLNREDRRTLERRLALLPTDVIERRPWLLVAHAWALGHAVQPQAQAQAIRQAEALLDNAQGSGQSDPGLHNLSALRANLDAMWSYVDYFANRTSAAIARSQRALALIPPSWAYVRGVAAFHLGLAMQADGEGSTAEDWLVGQYQALRDPGGVYGTRLLFTLGMIQLQSGDLASARGTAELMLRQAEAGGFGLLIGWARFILGTVHYQWDDIATAEQHLSEIVAHRYAANQLAVRDALVGLAISRLARGDGPGAWEHVDQLSALDLADRGHETAWVGALRARVQLWHGDVAAAGRWADGLTEIPDEPLIWLLAAPVVRAQVLLARGRAADVREALATLDAVMDLARRTHSTRYQIAVGTIRALAQHSVHNERAALEELRAAVVLARPGGFRRPFLDLGPGMRTLLGDLAATDPDNLGAREMLDAFAAANQRAGAGAAKPARAAANGRLVEPLTPRELETLALLGEPLGGREIAERLGVTMATYKRHTSNIYGKLGVSRRWDAIARAREAGLVPPR